MKDTIIVVADLGTCKAFRFDKDLNASTPSLQPIELPNEPNEYTKKSNTLTVMEKRSAKSGSDSRTNNSASDGEQHNMELEKRRRAVKVIAENIRKVLTPNPELRCFVAAPKEILTQVLETVGGPLKVRIEKALPLDLTRVHKSELVRHFEANGAVK